MVFIEADDGCYAAHIDLCVYDRVSVEAILFLSLTSLSLQSALMNASCIFKSIDA